MQPLFAALNEGLSQHLGHKQQPLLALTRAWGELVGPKLAMHTLPVKITPKGMLVVKVAGASLAHELAQMRSALLPKLVPFGVTQLRTRVSAKLPNAMLPPAGSTAADELTPKEFARQIREAHHQHLLAAREKARAEQAAESATAETEILPAAPPEEPPPPPAAPTEESPPPATGEAGDAPPSFGKALAAAWEKKQQQA